MSFIKLVTGPLFDGQLSRQILIQSNKIVWSVTFGNSDVIHLYKSTDNGITFSINTIYNEDVDDAFIAEDISGRLWRIAFYGTPQQWLLERSDDNGDTWNIIGSTPTADIFVNGPNSYFDNSLSGLVCHPTDKDKLAFAGSSQFYDGSTYINGACPVWTVVDGITINQIILPMTDYQLSGYSTNDVIFLPNGRLIVSYSYEQNIDDIRIVSIAYSDDLNSFTEVQLLPSYNLDDFGWYEHLYLDLDGNIYCAFGRDIKSSGQHCFIWDIDGNCTDNQFVYEHGVFFVKSTDGIVWIQIGDFHVPESAEAGFDQHLPYIGYLTQAYVPGSNIAGMMHDGTLLHVWFRSWRGFPGPIDSGLSIYWTYDGTTWTEQTMFGPGGINAALPIGALSQRVKLN